MSKIMTATRSRLPGSQYFSYKLEENGRRARKFAALSVQDEDGVNTIGSCGSLILFSIEANWPAPSVYDVISYRQKLRPCIPSSSNLLLQVVGL